MAVPALNRAVSGEVSLEGVVVVVAAAAVAAVVVAK
jgi:hypothetical protein